MRRRIRGIGFERAAFAATWPDKRVCGSAANIVWRCGCGASETACGLADAWI